MNFHLPLVIDDLPVAIGCDAWKFRLRTNDKLSMTNGKCSLA
jgi:hypothetical protein